MITIKQGGNTATIDDDLIIESNNENLKDQLQDEVDFATYGGGNTLPVLLVLYTNLKSNQMYEVDMPQDDIDALRGLDDDEETIF